MAQHQRLFGTDGVRGIVGRELTPDFVLRLASAIGAFFGEGTRILIGRDVRAGGQMIERIVSAALLASGARVYEAGLVPTPALQYAVKSESFDGGVMITASHNPPEYNGIKVIGPDGIEIDRASEEEIERIFAEEKYSFVDWRKLTYEVSRYEGVIEKYVKGVIEHVDTEIVRSRGFKVLVDPANSVGSLTTPLIARMLGIKVITVNGDLNPLFSGRAPEPTPENLEQTSRVVAASDVVFGVAHDGDADRAIIIDDRGRVQWGDRTAILLARYLKEFRGERGTRIYTAVSSTNLVEKLLRPLGIEVVWTKVGSVGIARAMKADAGTLCGFEENGGFMYPPFQYVRDGGMTFALFAEMLARMGKKPSELYEELPRTYVLKERIRMGRDEAQRAVEAVKEAFKGYKMISVDGVRVEGEDFWLLVRPSGTEPLLRVMIEAGDEDMARKLWETVKSVIGVSG
ncbi:MAG: phosphoglucosamine mutase [Desulfurococcaceae archaeon]